MSSYDETEPFTSVSADDETVGIIEISSVKVVGHGESGDMAWTWATNLLHRRSELGRSDCALGQHLTSLGGGLSLLCHAGMYLRRSESAPEPHQT